MENVFEFLSVMSVGLITGVNFYISYVEIPARQSMHEKYQLENWQSIFPKADTLLKVFGRLPLPLLFITWNLTDNPLWFGVIIPLNILQLQMKNSCI